MGIIDKLKGLKGKADNWNEQRTNKSYSDRMARMNRQERQLDMREKEAATSQREYRINKKMGRINKYNQSRQPSSGGSLFDSNGGSNIFDMGMGGGMGGDLFSMDMGGGGLFESGLGGAGHKKKRRNKKAKKSNGKDIHIHIK